MSRNTYNKYRNEPLLHPDSQKTEAERNEEAEATILATVASRKKLASYMELAKGIQYTESLKTS